jgi:hypothetical protein
MKRAFVSFIALPAVALGVLTAAAQSAPGTIDAAQAVTPSPLTRQ